jgi:hypothetical protein
MIRKSGHRFSDQIMLKRTASLAGAGLIVIGRCTLARRLTGLWSGFSAAPQLPQQDLSE